MKRRRKRHTRRFYPCDGCGGRVDLDSSDAVMFRRPDESELGLTFLLLHDNERCAMRALERLEQYHPRSEETKARIAWREFVKQNPETAAMLMTVAAMKGESG